MPTANDNAFTDKAYFCPGCGSSMVNASALSGSEASCGVCNWSGKTDDLVAVPFSQSMGSPEEIFRQLTIDIRQLLAKDTATDLIKLLAKWGFLGPMIDKQEVARYFGGIAKGITQGILETRQEIEKEKALRS